MKEPRAYQLRAIDRFFSYFEERSGHPLFVLPTGSGKSLVIAEIAKRILDEYPDERIVVFAHRKELLEQNLEAWIEQGGDPKKAGIISAGLGRRDLGRSLTFAGIQSVARKPEELGRVGLAFIDEAHLVPTRTSSMYRKTLSALSTIEPFLKVVGFTATHFRLDGGFLHTGDDRLFTDLAIDVPVTELIAAKHLAPLTAKRAKAPIETKGVRRTRGDFAKGELEKRALASNVVAAVDEVAREIRAGRKHAIVFGCGVEHAREIVRAFRDRGLEAFSVLGSTKADVREKVLSAAKAGHVDVLVGVDVLTTGFNWPECDLVALMRPTQSAALYVQMLGRGMRIAEGKTDCLVLDYGGNVERHGPIDDLLIRDPKKGEAGEPPVRACPGCDTYVSLATPRCPKCGFEFPRRDPKKPTHDATASDDEPLAANRKPREYVVGDWSHFRHEKEGRPDSVCVSYARPGNLTRDISEWVCPAHGGMASAKADEWWIRHGGEAPVPTSATEFLERTDELEQPSRILVVREGKFDRVIARHFEKETVDVETK